MTIALNSGAPTVAAADLDRLHPDMRAFLDEGDLSATAIDAFLETRRLPLVERGAVSFLWRGEAARVDLLRWIGSGVDRNAFARIEGSDLWHLRIPVEDGGRFEYKLNIIKGGSEAWVMDPRNPDRAGDPFGENSVAMTYGYARPEWSLPRGAPEGRVVEMQVKSEVFGETRSERVYLPAGYDGQSPYPVLVIHDGGEYAEYADLTVALDNLIDARDIPAVVAVLIQAGNRMIEYPKGRRHARYVVRELLTTVEAQFSVSNRPEDRVLQGASLGAVASLATAFRYPGVFGGLILKSGSFILDPAALRHRPDPVFHRVARLLEAARRVPDLPDTRAFVSTGELEGLAEENRAMARFLKNRGVDVQFQSSWDGHHWHNWRDQLRDALMWVLKPRDG